ncbi:hypothetical protein OG301_39160 (plasmid) [Streptomyces platensis]|uniref:hypothetical protein n=1 Tax=Streptomyces platensis TaxID=58346 RepID=UPI002ED3750E|nr:hypothetical protein OG301_39160 [Streptomyces platensis]
MNASAQPEPVDPQLTNAIDAIFVDYEIANLGRWEPDVMDIVRSAYQPNALFTLAHELGVTEGGDL